MPVIRSSTDLRNSYNDISTFCHENAEAIFITKNGRGDLAVMSIDLYEALTARQELYGLLDVGTQDIKAGRTRPAQQVFAELRADLANETL
jgi:PHD/YefM family antitoxin component YafN of YafNO toxin-antitoxin module